MKLYRHVSAVMAALVLTGLSYSAGATDINVGAVTRVWKSFFNLSNT